ncbi:hypothetical protein A2U01_0068853, partial [Trifolium medium]|nr:hypothetical protein [Trifolium medium]
MPSLKAQWRTTGAKSNYNYRHLSGILHENTVVLTTHGIG